MDPRKAQVLEEWITEILRRNWDPVGLEHRPEAAGEYVSGVCRLLASGASSREIATHLRDVETIWLGFEDTEVRMLIPVAKKLQRAYARVAEP